MARAPIASFAVSAFAMVVLTAAGPANQTAAPNYPSPNQVGPWTDANPPPFTPNSNPYLYQNAAAQEVPQLFRFPSLSNKSAGRQGCMAGSAKTQSRPRVVATFPANGAVVR